jgi:hypothetical protein
MPSWSSALLPRPLVRHFSQSPMPQSKLEPAKFDTLASDGSRVPGPVARIPNPESRIPNPESRIPRQQFMRASRPRAQHQNRRFIVSQEIKMEVDQNKKECRYEPCGCKVEAGHPYCSEYCRSAAEVSDQAPTDENGRGACGCGHSQCGSGA